MSVSVAGMLEAGKHPDVEARWSRNRAPTGNRRCPPGPATSPRARHADPGNQVDFEEVLCYATLIAPKLTIQGGTRGILRGIVARGLGLR